MIIYLVIGNLNGALHAKFFSTNRESQEYIEQVSLESDWCDIDISEYEIAPSKIGMVKALNQFIHHIALNDG